MVINWMGDNPDICQLCSTKIEDVFVDGKTQGGPWVVMCTVCALSKGVGLGIGKGQLYEKKAETFVKIKG